MVFVVCAGCGLLITAYFSRLSMQVGFIDSVWV